jgi:hypothetical protein
MGLVEKAERENEIHIIITRSLPSTCQNQLSSTGVDYRKNIIFTIGTFRNTNKSIFKAEMARE